MKTRITLTLITLVNFQIVFAQTTFQKIYGDTINQWGYSVKPCFDKGYIAVGYTTPYQGQSNMFVVKTDSTGDTLWTRRFGGDNMVAFDVIQTSDSDYMVAGYTNSKGMGILKKLNPDGEVVFSRIYPEGWIQAVQQTNDGGYLCGGKMLYKTNSTGTVSWSVGTQGQIMYAIQAADSNYVTLGYAVNTLFLRKVNPAGKTIWTRYMNGTLQNTSNNCLAQTVDGGYILTGKHASDSGALLIKTDSTGDTVWTRVFPLLQYGTAVIQSNDTGYAICGKTVGNQLALLKTDAYGMLQWSTTLPEGNWDEAKSVRQTEDGGYVMCGGTYSIDNKNKDDLLLIKTKSNGTVTMGIRNFAGRINPILNVHPNPAASETTITSSLLENSDLTIFDARGKMVKQINGIQSQTITLFRDNLPNGIYFIRLSQVNKIIASQIFILHDGM